MTDTGWSLHLLSFAFAAVVLEGGDEHGRCGPYPLLASGVPLPMHALLRSFRAMFCNSCGRDSNNRRVCPFCFTPFPPTDDGTAPSLRRAPPTPAVGQRSLSGTAGQAARDSSDFFRRQTPVVRWSALGIVVVLVLWAFTGGNDSLPNGGAGIVGGPQAASDLLPVTLEQAIAHLEATRNTALVETHADEVFVSYPAATFPVRKDGQLRLVQLYAQADSTVEGRRRRIFFYNPAGRLFAQSDAVTGITIK